MKKLYSLSFNLHTRKVKGYSRFFFLNRSPPSLDRFVLKGEEGKGKVAVRG